MAGQPMRCDGCGTYLTGLANGRCPLCGGKTHSLTLSDEESFEESILSTLSIAPAIRREEAAEICKSKTAPDTWVLAFVPYRIWTISRSETRTIHVRRHFASNRYRNRNILSYKYDWQHDHDQRFDIEGRRERRTPSRRKIADETITVSFDVRDATLPKLMSGLIPSYQSEVIERYAPDGLRSLIEILDEMEGIVDDIPIAYEAPSGDDNDGETAITLLHEAIRMETTGEGGLYYETLTNAEERAIDEAYKKDGRLIPFDIESTVAWAVPELSEIDGKDEISYRDVMVPVWMGISTESEDNKRHSICVNAQTGEVVDRNMPKPDAHIDEDETSRTNLLLVLTVIGALLWIAMTSDAISTLIVLVVMGAYAYLFARARVAAEDHSFPFNSSDGKSAPAGRTRMTLCDMGTILLVEDVKVDIDLANKNLPTGKAWEYDPDWQIGRAHV